MASKPAPKAKAAAKETAPKKEAAAPAPAPAAAAAAKPSAETKPAVKKPAAKPAAKASKPAAGAAIAKAKKPAAKKTGRKKKISLKFTVDCTKPVEDVIMDPASFEKFLRDRIKVHGKAGNLGDNVSVSREKTKVHIASDVPMSKAYIKYLTKKFLKKQKLDGVTDLRDHLRVVSTNKTTYELRYFNIESNPEDAGDQ